MSETLLLFIHSKNIDVYVNVLTHCVNHRDVREMFFVGNQETPERRFELVEFIGRIRQRITELAKTYPEYVEVRERFPNAAQFEDRIMRVVFTNPHDMIPKIEERFPKKSQLIVDVSGCSKRLASDVMTSFMVKDIEHVCHFELSDKVYSDEWQNSGRKMLYHDLIGEVVYYEYDDFSKPGTTSASIDRLRAQGKWIKALLLISVVLGIVVVTLISTQQTTLALVAAIVLAAITGIGALEDSLSLFERFRG